jgi:L-lysine 2,3-aminomutase
MKNTGTIIPVSSANCQVNSWKSQLKSAFGTAKSLLDYLQIGSNESAKIIDNMPDFRVRVPKAFADKMAIGDINDPLLMQVLSTQQEKISIQGYTSDPLLEQQNQRPGLLHKYHDRVLLLLTGSCAVNCRYCFRRHFPYQTAKSEQNNLQANLQYIAGNQAIKEVILSGGDPLLTSDSQLQELVSQLESINHLKHLRIHTRLPIVLPDRVTDRLIEIMANSRLNTTLVVHANHPNEIDDYTGKKLQQLVINGTNVFNQSVLLKGINDQSEILQALSEQMIQYQIIPYYLHLLDPVAGAAHFDCDKDLAIKIIQQMRATMPGYLVPRLAVEEPNTPCKTLINS